VYFNGSFMRVVLCRLCGIRRVHVEPWPKFRACEHPFARHEPKFEPFSAFPRGVHEKIEIKFFATDVSEAERQRLCDGTSFRGRELTEIMRATFGRDPYFVIKRSFGHGSGDVAVLKEWDPSGRCGSSTERTRHGHRPQLSVRMKLCCARVLPFVLIEEHGRDATITERATETACIEREKFFDPSSVPGSKLFRMLATFDDQFLPSVYAASVRDEDRIRVRDRQERPSASKDLLAVQTFWTKRTAAGLFTEPFCAMRRKEYETARAGVPRDPGIRVPFHG